MFSNLGIDTELDFNHSQNWNSDYTDPKGCHLSGETLSAEWLVQIEHGAELSIYFPPPLYFGFLFLGYVILPSMTKNIILSSGSDVVFYLTSVTHFVDTPYTLSKVTVPITSPYSFSRIILSNLNSVVEEEVRESRSQNFEKNHLNAYWSHQELQG